MLAATFLKKANQYGGSIVGGYSVDYEDGAQRVVRT